MRLFISRSYKSLAESLTQAKETAEQDASRGTRLISNTYLTKIARTLSDLDVAQEAQAKGNHALAKAREARNAAREALIVIIRAFWEVAQRRQRTLELDSSSLLLYQIPKPKPEFDQPLGWQNYARNIINGEVEAQALGLPAMANPSAEDIAARLEGYNLLIQEFDAAYRAATLSKDELSRQLKIAETCLRNMGRRLRESLTDKPDSVQREIMRTYGLDFKSSQPANPEPEGQTPEGEGGQAPEPAPLNTAKARKARQTKKEKQLQRKVERSLRKNEVLQQQLQDLLEANESLREENQEYRDSLGSIHGEFQNLKKDFNKLAAQQQHQEADSNGSEEMGTPLTHVDNESDSADSEQQGTAENGK